MSCLSFNLHVPSRWPSAWHIWHLFYLVFLHPNTLWLNYNSYVKKFARKLYPYLAVISYCSLCHHIYEKATMLSEHKYFENINERNYSTGGRFISVESEAWMMLWIIRVVYVERHLVVCVWWNVNKSFSMLRKLPKTYFLAWILSTANKSLWFKLA